MVQVENDTMAVVLSQPSPYRKQLLKIAKMLSREDVDELLFLSEDFIPQSEQEQIRSSGVNLMRCLIRRGRLEPGNCYYLYFCLNEIGRVDLARSLAEFYLMPPLPFTPPSFCLPSQMMGTKLTIIARSKQAKHKQQFKFFMQSEAQWASECRELLQGLMNDVYPLPCASNVENILGSTLEQISKTVDAQTTAMTQFEMTKYPLQFTKYVQEADACYKKLQSTLEGIQWRKQQHWHVQSRAHDVCFCFVDFFSELLGKQVGTKLSEMMYYLSHMYMPTSVLGILHWLFVAIEEVTSSSLDVQSCEAQLTSILTQFREKGCIYHWEIVGTLLEGTKILEKAQKDGFLIAAHEIPISDPTSLVHNSPILLGIFTCLLVLRYSAVATSEDWEQIKANFTLNAKAFGSMMFHRTRIMRTRASGCLHEELLQAVLKEGVHVPGLQEVIREIIHNL